MKNPNQKSQAKTERAYTNQSERDEPTTSAADEASYDGDNRGQHSEHGDGGRTTKYVNAQ